MSTKSSNKLMDGHSDAYMLEPEESQVITKERLKAILPKGSTASVGPKILELINSMGDSTGLPQNLLEEQFLGNLHIMNKMKGIGTLDIINATKFCNLKRNYSNRRAWSIVFPKQYNRLVENDQKIDNHVSMYNGRKLVQMIDEEMLIPVHLQYIPNFHSAISELTKIGVYANSGEDSNGKAIVVTPMVRVQALKELAVLTKPPVQSKIDITVSQGKEAEESQRNMNEQLSKIAAHLEQSVASGKSVEEIQAIDIDIITSGSD
ncbi:MAG: hypothetical protein L3I99_05820 [Sulfurimonas sp.]|nr:hypothetical protein [Sulfurimonas sp.]